MVFWPFEVTTPHIVYAVLGGFIVLFGMFSLFLRSRLYVGEAIWAFIIGVIIGPYCANIFNPRAFSKGDDAEDVANVITLELTRIILAIGVFAIGVELPKAYMRKHWKSLLFLLGPVMTWGWFVSAGLIYALIPGLNFLSSLAVAACLTPTDPILAAAVVGGKWADKHVPAHIRHLLAAESGCNDGAAFPFLYLALYLTIDKTTGSAVRDWIVLLWLYQVVLGCFIGGALGFGFRHLMKFCQRHDLIDRHSYVAQYVSLAILTIGLTTLLGSDDLLAAFVCGTVFAWDGFFNKQTEESVFSSVIDTLFNVAAFIYVGAWMPFSAFENKELTLSVWRLLVIAILVLLLRRLPVMVALYKWIPDIKTFQEAVFSGHFGPIGIGAVFISTLAIEILHDAHEAGPHGTADQHRPETEQSKLLAETIQPIVAFMVLCSIAVHGLSIPSFSLGRRVHSVSRTWSRRDTTTLTSQRRGNMPEWANQARLVHRAEDVVVNRDMPRPGEEIDLDLERGDLEKRSDIESSEEEGSQRIGSRRTGERDVEKMADSGLSGETKVHVVEPGHSSPISVGPSRPSTAEEREPAPERPGSPRFAAVRTRAEEDNPPDGTEAISEWIEGSHRVIEKRMGPGSDVEVIVVDDSPQSQEQRGGAKTRWQGKVHELEHNAQEVGKAINLELGRMTSLVTCAAGSDRSASQHARGRSGSLGSLFRTSSSTATKDVVVLSKAKRREMEERKQQQASTSKAVVGAAGASADDNGETDEGEWTSEAERDEPEPSTPVTPTASKSRRHHPLQHVVHGAASRMRRHTSSKRTSGSASSPPGSTMTTIGSPTSTSTATPRSNMTTPIITAPSPSRPAPHRPPAHHSSTSSSTSSITTSSPATPTVGPSSILLPSERTGTLDQSFSHPARNNRVESIRGASGTGYHSRKSSRNGSLPGTRDSSPSRNVVRFAEEPTEQPPPASSPSSPAVSTTSSIVGATMSVISPYTRSGLPGLSALGTPVSASVPSAPSSDSPVEEISKEERRPRR